MPKEGRVILGYIVRGGGGPRMGVQGRVQRLAGQLFAGDHLYMEYHIKCSIARATNKHCGRGYKVHCQ